MSFVGRVGTSFVKPTECITNPIKTSSHEIYLVNPTSNQPQCPFAGCDERHRQPGIGTQSPSIHKLERLNASMRDADLENAVRTKLENDPQLKSADVSVNADAVRNEVTLFVGIGTQ
jgi:hypothetical protein